LTNFANGDEDEEKLPRNKKTVHCNPLQTVGLSGQEVLTQDGGGLPYLFEFDPRNGLLQGRLYGRVTSEEIREYYRVGMKCLAAKRPRAGITDMTGITLFEVAPQTVRELASLPPTLADQELLRVIVASAPDVFGMARMFESHGEATRPNLHVVRTCKEALIIVGVQEPKYEPIDMSDLGETNQKK
jgi:hypothetical protein